MTTMIFTSPQCLHCYNTNTWHKAMEIALNLESQVLPAIIIRDVGGARDNHSDGWPREHTDLYCCVHNEYCSVNIMIIIFIYKLLN